MTYHHIQYLLCVFAFFNLMSCTHQSVIKSSSAHIDQSQSSCPICKQARSPSLYERKVLQMETSDQREIYDAHGCVQCAYKGYRGRTALMEILRIDSEIDALISRRAHLDEFRAVAISKGFVSLADDGVRLVLNGMTSLTELMRVVDLSSRIYH